MSSKNFKGKRVPQFELSARSRGNLEGVHPILVAIVEKAIKLTPVDFIVIQGLRTKKQQEKFVKAGKSQIMKSKHLKQEDGFGHAVDLMAYVGGDACWEFKPYYPIVKAMKKAASGCTSVRIRWGGCWRFLDEISDPRQAVKEYSERKSKTGQDAFFDLPHFEVHL